MSEDILDIVRSGDTLKDLPLIVEKLKNFDESDLFNTLFPLAVQEQGLGKGVAFAAYSLNELNPRALISAKEAVMSLLLEWNISIGEVVFYLFKQFGAETVLNITADLKVKVTENESLVRIKTIEYWLTTQNA